MKKHINGGKMNYLFLLVIPALVFGHGGEKHEKLEAPKKVEKVEVVDKVKETYAQINEEYLKNIKPIFELKCFDCHSDKTKDYWYSDLPIVSSIIKSDIEEAKEHLDFSKDFPFISHETPKKDLLSILEVFEEGEMPPFEYKIMHSEAKVTQNDVDKIKFWVENSLKQLDKK